VAHYSCQYIPFLSLRVYPFQKDQNILQFLDDFNDYNSNDDEMWERSKEIKPTSTK